MPRLRRSFPYLLIASLVALVFGQAIAFRFVTWDDTLLITDNPYYRPLTWHSLVALLASAYGGLSMPLTYAWWALLSVVSRWFGAVPADPFDPRVYHAGNLFLHLACGALAYAIILRLVRHRAAALLAALLFLLHPLQVETVAWATEAKGLLAAFFSFLAIWLILPAEVSPGGAAAPARPARQLLAWLCFLLALTAKPSAVALPLVVIAIDCLTLARPLGAALVSRASWFLLAFFWVLVTQTAQPTATLAPHVPLWQRPFIAGDALAFYLGKLLWPRPLGVDYGRTPAAIMHGPWWAVAWLVPVIALALALFASSTRAARAGLAIGLATLIPVSGLLTFQFQRVSTVADRYMYLPLFGIALWLAALIARRGRLAQIVLAAWIALLALWSWQAAPAWRNSQALFTQALRVNPRSASALINLAVEQYRAGDHNAAADLYRQALAVDPLAAAANTGLAAVYNDRGDYAASRALFDRILAAHPQLDWAHAGAGRAAHHLGDTAAARDHDRLALAPNPLDGSTTLTAVERAATANRLARILATDADDALRDGREAERWAREANRLTRYQHPAYLDTLAAAFAEQGRFDRAIDQAAKALKNATHRGDELRAWRIQKHLESFTAGHPLRESPAEQLLP